MAIPQVLREADYSSVDFSNKATGALEVLKDALTSKLGWALEYEDTTSADKSFVVSNNGTGNYLKFILEDGETNYLKLQAAQSWSDINTPLNLLRDFYIDARYMANHFLIVGNDKAFYLYTTSALDGIGTSNGTSNGFFFGDIIPNVENDPLSFIVTPSDRTNDVVISAKKAASSYPGVLLESNYMDSLFSQSSPYAYIVGTDLKNYSLVAPGAMNAAPSNFSIDFSAMPNSNPTILTDVHICEPSASANPDKSQKIIGRFPGLAFNASLNNLVAPANRFDSITIAGESCVTIPDKDYWCMGVIRLTDWDLL